MFSMGLISIRALGRPGTVEQVDVIGGQPVHGDEGLVQRCVVLKKERMLRVTLVKRENNWFKNLIHVSQSVEVIIN